MSTVRAQVIDVFEDLHHLLCEFGMFVEGNSTDGTWLLYWGNGNVRSLVKFRDGFRDGLSVNFHPNGEVSSFSYYRDGRKWGESAVRANDGRFLKHVFNGESGEINYNDSMKDQYVGYHIDLEITLIQRKFRIQWDKLM